VRSASASYRPWRCCSPSSMPGWWSAPGPTRTLRSLSMVGLDLDGDGSPVILATAGTSSVGEVEVSAAVSPWYDSTLRFVPLQPGAVVDGSRQFTLYTAILETAVIDPFDPRNNHPGGTGTADYGFRFTSAGTTHYGWAHMTATAVVQPAPFASAGIDQWAYESDPNTPITVGAIPEPAIAALILVALPALLRRR
jgi:hypothetical protein